MLTHKTERLRIVGSLLQRFGIDLTQGLAASDPEPFLDAVWRWTAEEWPALYDPTLATLDAWLASRREGPKIVFSLVMDLALVLGEMVLVRRPAYSWALDLDPGNKADTKDETMVS